MADNDRRTLELESKTVTANAKLQIQCKGLPKGLRVTHMTLVGEATVGNSAAGAVSVYTQQLSRFIAQCYWKAPLFELRSTGRALWALYRLMRGKVPMNAAQSVAGGGGTSAMRHVSIIPFADFNAANPMDTAMPTELLEGTTLEAIVASTLAVGSGGGGSQTINAMTLRPVLHFGVGASEPGNVKLPSAQLIDYEDWNQLTAYLKAGGGFSHLCEYDESDDVVTMAEYDRLRVQLDGSDVVDRLTSGLLAAEYNDKVALGGAAPDATTPGVADTEQIGTHGGSMGFCPLIMQAPGYKLSQLPHAERTARVDSSGTATSQRLLYRLIRDLEGDAAEVREAAKLMGIKEPSRAVFVPATIKGNALQGNAARVARLERRLPKRIGVAA